MDTGSVEKKQMDPTVLDVGQCSYDHGNIRRLLESMDLHVKQAESIPEALEILRRDDIRLVLVNRVLDMDRSDGLELIRKIRSDPDLERIPVLLVSDLPEAQARARDAGAREGFGKKALKSPQTLEKIRNALNGV